LKRWPRPNRGWPKWWECATFGSYSEAEIADTLHLTDRSVRRD